VVAGIIEFVIIQIILSVSMPT